MLLNTFINGLDVRWSAPTPPCKILKGLHTAEAIGYKVLQKVQQSQVQNLAPGIKQNSATVQTGD